MSQELRNPSKPVPSAPPPPASRGVPAPMASAAATTRKTVQFGKPHTQAGHRVVLYGPGGIGKTTMATYAPAPVAFIDLDDSLPILWPQIEANGLAESVRPVTGIETWPQLIDALNGDGWDDIKTIVIDTLTRAEELCVASILKTIPHEKGGLVACLQDYGFGKGVAYAYDQFLPLLATLESHCRAGRHVIMNCHECSATFPNPMGQDFLRYEPRLQSPNSGKASIRLRMREWSDHLLFLAYDVTANKEGKGVGCGSRTLYPRELPYCMAKSRTIADPMPYGDNAAEIWNTVFGIK